MTDLVIHPTGPVDIQLSADTCLVNLPDFTVTQATAAEPEPEPESQWAYPVGSEEFPTVKWYASQGHRWDAATNPDGHTGCDLNVDQAPWGDVDRGQPIYAVADGIVHDRGYSAGWVGVIVVKHQHDGADLYVRYAHLDSNSFEVEIADQVNAADLLAKLGNYQAADTGDHLHFDDCLDPITWSEFKTHTKRWVDPVPILKAHLDPAVVDAMLKKD